MRRISTLFLILLLAVLIAGCKTKPVSRIYKANFNDTWAATLAAVEARTGKPADSADKEFGKIVTAWNTGTVTNETDYLLSSRKNVDTWRGIITVAKDITGTKVIVRLQKGRYSESPSAASNANPDTSINIVVADSNKEPQEEFLNEVEQQLTKIYQKKKNK